VSRRPSEWLVLFDMDDTLLDTSPIFEAAVLKFTLMLAELGVPVEETRARLSQIDMGRIEEMGFGKHRWPESIGLTYRSLAHERSLRYDRHLEEACAAIGWATYEEYPPVKPGALEALETLRPRVRLALATKGDRELQSGRLERSGLRHHFDDVYILPQKTVAEFRAILGELNYRAERAFMVGDGIRSDINPPMELGMHAIHVRGDSWEHERVPPIRGDFHAVDALAEVPPLVFAAMARVE
jgi:putative hydrolase of the HAD superfamily